MRVEHESPLAAEGRELQCNDKLGCYDGSPYTAWLREHAEEFFSALDELERLRRRDPA